MPSTTQNTPRILFKKGLSKEKVSGSPPKSLAPGKVVRILSLPSMTVHKPTSDIDGHDAYSACLPGMNAVPGVARNIGDNL
jgi:hypothetical protein